MAASPIRPWKSLKLKTVTSESGVQVDGELLAWAEPVAALVDGVASLLGELLADALADGAALADPVGAALPVGVLAHSVLRTHSDSATRWGWHLLPDPSRRSNRSSR